MELYTINTGFFKLDGGAMFGVVPKKLWSRTSPSDENNLCTWAMRCLLIVDEGKIILIDNGIGNKQDEKFFGHYELHGTDSLTSSLHHLGIDFKDITDNFLTHLHFDHCGGSIAYSSDRTKLKTAFPNANYWSNKHHWEWAVNPNAREKASFLKENILPIEESGQLKFIDLPNEGLKPHFDVLIMDGHTEKQMLPKINYKNHTIIFAADLLPSVSHIPIPYVMGYDVRPLVTLKEKKLFLEEAAKNNYIIFLEHDPNYECCTVKMTEKGVVLDKTFALHEL